MLTPCGISDCLYSIGIWHSRNNPGVKVPLFRIRFILLWIRILLQIRPKIRKILTFFAIKKIYFSEIWSVFFCFVIYGVNIYVSKLKFNSFEKNVWYSNDFCWNFPWFWLVFCFNETDPDPADQNETNPNGSGSETLGETIVNVQDQPRIQCTNTKYHCFGSVSFWYVYGSGSRENTNFFFYFFF